MKLVHGKILPVMLLDVNVRECKYGYLIRVSIQALAKASTIDEGNCVSFKLDALKKT